jgi:hypothetical protein
MQTLAVPRYPMANVYTMFLIVLSTIPSGETKILQENKALTQRDPKKNMLGELSIVMETEVHKFL